MLLPLTSQEGRSVSELTSSSLRNLEDVGIHPCPATYSENHCLSPCLGQLFCQMGMQLPFLCASLGHWEDQVGDRMCKDLVKHVDKRSRCGIPCLCTHLPAPCSFLPLDLCPGCLLRLECPSSCFSLPKTSLPVRSLRKIHFFQDVSPSLHRLENFSWFSFASSAFLSNSSTPVCL